LLKPNIKNTASKLIVFCTHIQYVYICSIILWVRLCLTKVHLIYCLVDSHMVCLKPLTLIWMAGDLQDSQNFLFLSFLILFFVWLYK
jgi:hypothetical protein